MPRQWNAESYDDVAAPQQRWGEAVLERLEHQLVDDGDGERRVSDGERQMVDGCVLDAGCGTGRVTALLLERLPAVRVVALDEASGMLDVARQRLAVYGDRVEFVQADLGRALPLGQPVDAVLSTATFHWVADHDALFTHLAAVLVPGGSLVAQCGGEGNLATVQGVLAQIGDGWLGPAHYANVADTTRRLAAADFVDVEVWLHDEPTPFPDRATFAPFLRTVILGPHLQRLPERDRDRFVEEFIDRLGVLALDYVRLNIVARRPLR